MRRKRTRTPRRKGMARRWKRRRGAPSSGAAESKVVRVPVRGESQTGGDPSAINFPRPASAGVGAGASRWESGRPSGTPSGDRATMVGEASKGKRSAKRRFGRRKKVSESAAEGKTRRTRRLSFRSSNRGSGTGAEVDPRIAERARQVREKEEHKAVQRAVWLLAIMAVVGIGVWLAHSPYLAVRNVVVTGQVSSSVAEYLQGREVIEGVPMMSVDEDALRQGLLSDPWVEEVEIQKEWPGTIRIDLKERHPVAWVLTGKGWNAVSADVVVLDVDAETPMPHVTGLASAPLDLSHPDVEKALTFLEHLRSDLQISTALEIHGPQVTAEVAGRIVRLGRATDLEEKAAVLGVLIDQHTDPGSVINLFSPLRPAVYKGIDTNIVIPLPSS